MDKQKQDNQDNLHQALLEYLMQYKPLAQWHFATNSVEHEAVNVIPVSGEMFTEKWIDGGGICYYDFVINIFTSNSDTPYIADCDNENIDNLFDAYQFMKWIDMQNTAGSYPNFGLNYSVADVIVLQNFPTIAGIGAEQGNNYTKLSFPARVIYLKENYI